MRRSLETLCVQTEQCRKVTCQVKSLGTQGKTKCIWLVFLFFFLTFALAVRAPWGLSMKPSLGGRYLEKPGVEEEGIGGLCEVVAVQVKVAEFVQVPVWEIFNHQMQEECRR